MKKILFILIALVFSASVVAQEYDPTQKYGFWSNWNAGINIVVSDPVLSEMSFTPGFGANIELSKQLSSHWMYRLVGDVPVIYRTESTHDRYGAALMGVMWFPFNCGLYAATDAGISVKIDGNYQGYFTTDLGLGYRWNIGQHNMVKVELGAECIHPIRDYDRYVNHFARVGWAYRFGATKIDREIIAQRKLLLENYDGFVGKYDSLRAAHIDTCAKLERLTLIYDDQNKTIDSLKVTIVYLNSVIDSISDAYDNAVNYVSAPAVMFNVNSYTISNDQKAYVDYIANYVKNYNDTVYVYGYADAMTGSIEYNNALSEKRAQALKDALVKRGCKKEYILIEGLGSNLYIGDGNSAAARKAIVIIPMEDEDY